MKKLLLAGFALLFIFSNESFAKTFTEKDFYWDDATTPYKEIIIKGVNKVYKENSRCKIIDPSSAYISSSKGTKNNPVFYVTCGKGQNTFNAFFSKKDVEKATKLVAKKHIKESKAISLCEAYAKEKAVHPSTVKFSKLTDISTTEHANGRTTVLSTFTAKNTLNLKLKYDITCLFDKKGLIEANISENK